MAERIWPPPPGAGVPRFERGQYVEIDGVGIKFGTGLYGQRFVLWGHPEYINGMWSWPTPPQWQDLIRKLGVKAPGFYVGEARFKLVSDDGARPIGWHDPAVVWRPRLSIVRNFDGAYYDVATGERLVGQKR